ncbi:nuclear transport factor 2 family protein [Streptomyces sp. DSM 41524]|uniref:Nuclear transport factor 2 family protein n=1 Tax=Streptomyces asiaticus subsp. ignotus TaxID=3098222 RepID=A0ABU7Q4X2_9ACTN|nr:nuclear transport factor 2 family protein [Streptomyces sp. DSM 41524]
MSDRDAIMELSAKYMHTLDLGDRDGWLSCWTEDGYFERYKSTNRARGIEELGTLIFDKAPHGFHITSDYAITIDGDSATVQCYLLFINELKKCEVSMFGVYRDKVRRTADGWRYSERVFEPKYIVHSIPNVIVEA